MSENKLLFGTAGVPLTTNHTKNKTLTAEGVKEVARLSLNALELEFVRNVYLKNSKEEEIKEIETLAKKNNISLSAHAPYFINLNAKEKYKIDNSKRFIVDSLNVGQKVGVKIVVFHAGYFLKQPREEVLENVSKNLETIFKSYDYKNIRLGMELTGKENQVGSLEDLFFFYERFKEYNFFPVLDLSHMHARYNGYFLKQKNIDDFFNKLKSYDKVIKNLHIHLSGIQYSEKGEYKHLMLKEADIPYKKLLEKIKEIGGKGTIICESPITHEDALLLKKTYESL